MSAALRPALLLDRDGVVNVDRGYVHRREDFEWLPGIFDLARTARRLALPIVIVTNQSGIGRGYYTQADFEMLTDFVRERFTREDAPISAVYHCPFHPQAEIAAFRHPDHPWRKPRPGMILQARDDLGLDLARSFMLGDRISDIQAAEAAGIGHIGVIGTKPMPAAGLPAFERFATPGEAVVWLEAVARPASDVA